MTIGLIGRKCGMTRVFTEDGMSLPVTVIEVTPNRVTQIKTIDNDGYRPQFYFRTTDVTGAAKLPEGVEMVMPGDNVQMEVELITPIAMDNQLRFAIREGGRTVGSGVVTEIME